LLQGLPNLKLLVTGGMRNAAIDLAAAKALGIQVCGTDSYKHAAPELTWALIMASTRNLLAEANSLRAGHWQVGLGRRPAWPDPGNPGAGQHWPEGRAICPSVRDAGDCLE
jgi:lactate dehydrogenase-like 2-hydroxyacid dehydrogenase